MPGSTPALLQAIYTAYREKRLADVLALLTDDFQFTLHLPAESLPGAGAPHGKADTAKMYFKAALGRDPLVDLDPRAFGEQERQMFQQARRELFRVGLRPIPRDTIDPRSLDHLIAAHNNTPRKCLDFKTPAEVFSAKLLHFKRDSTPSLRSG